MLAVPVLAQTLRDVKPPVAFPPNYFWLFLLLVAAVILTAVYFLRGLFKRRRRGQRPLPVVIRQPWEVACEELARLKAENLPGQGRIKEYFIRLSDILRHYIEDRFSVRAPEMTTEEFLLSLKKARELSEAQKKDLRGFLQCCDMVKFARHGSTISEMEQALTLVERLLEETRPAPLSETGARHGV